MDFWNYKDAELQGIDPILFFFSFSDTNTVSGIFFLSDGFPTTEVCFQTIQYGWINNYEYYESDLTLRAQIQFISSATQLSASDISEINFRPFGVIAVRFSKHFYNFLSYVFTVMWKCWGFFFFQVSLGQKLCGNDFIVAYRLCKHWISFQSHYFADLPPTAARRTVSYRFFFFFYNNFINVLLYCKNSFPAQQVHYPLTKIALSLLLLDTSVMHRGVLMDTRADICERRPRRILLLVTVFYCFIIIFRNTWKIFIVTHGI